MWRRNASRTLRRRLDDSDADAALTRLLVVSSSATAHRIVDLEHLLVARLALLADSPAGSRHTQRPVSKLMRGLGWPATDAAVGVHYVMVVVDLAMAEWWMISVMVHSV